jgi:predicted nucleotidyltransferase
MEVFSVSPKIFDLMEQYVFEMKKIYGSHIQKIILYGSYARGDYQDDSDIDIMILLDISDLEIKDYFEQLVSVTFDFNMEHDTDIKPIAKSNAHFQKWIINYPFYANINKEGVVLYGAA